MRPTLLEYKSPTEKTPDCYTINVTNRGERLNFATRSQNKKSSILPRAARFVNLEEDPESFVGPGKYNVDETLRKLTLRPCSTVIKRISVLPETESGKPCYYLVG